MTPRKLSERIFAGPALLAQPDRRLVALAREGHEEAVEEIVRRYRPALLRYAASIVPADRADDVVQDSLARALPGIGSGDAELHLRPWLYTIVRNAAFNNLRDAGPPHEHLDENYDGVEQPPQALERREDLRSLLAGLRGLPEAQREALVKREMEGLSHADIGVQLGVSVGAARQLIFRARNALRDGLGSLIPMPLLRQLLDGGNAGGAVVAGGGGAVAMKATMAVLATGAAITAGIAIKGSHPHSQAPAVAVRIGDTGKAQGSSGSGGGSNSSPTSPLSDRPGPPHAGQTSGGGAANAQVGAGGRFAAVGSPSGGGAGSHPAGSGEGGNASQGGQGRGTSSGNGGGESQVGGSSGGDGSGAPLQQQTSGGDGSPAGSGGGSSSGSDTSGGDSVGSSSGGSSGGDSSPSGDSGSATTSGSSATSGSTTSLLGQD